MVHQSARETFTAALDSLVAQVRQDRSILAALLCGSLSHDTVWEKSDIDLILITVDDAKIATGGMAVYADGVNVHALLVPRAQFRRLVEGSVQNSFMHALLVKGRLLYSHDETITRLCEGLRDLGSRDREIQLLRAATGALPMIYKAHKWLITRGDLDYTALWILYAATSLAGIEVIGAGMVADREVIPRATALNPALFDVIYTRLLNAKKTRAGVEAALDAADQYLAARATSLFSPVIAYLRAAGEARSCSEIEHHFKSHFDVSEVTTACEYLADQGLIGKVSLPARLTRKSTVTVQELAFVSLGDPTAANDENDEWRPR
jgi:predicted nucleotidyltransferase